MGVKLTQQEVWEFIEAAQVGILTTIRQSGWPVALPVWFTIADEVVHTRTPATAAKVKRLRANPKCGFLVESGESWGELAAVSIEATGKVLDWDLPEEAAEAEAAAAEIDRKYEGLRPHSDLLPDATKEHYRERVIIRLEPTGPMVSWDNRKIRLKGD